MEELVPSEFYLGQNYPNPFEDKTTIKYCLPVKTKVNISVFDHNGNKLRELVNDIKEAGTYEIKLFHRDLPAGNYYYRMQTSSFLDSKTMCTLT